MRRFFGTVATGLLIMLVAGAGIALAAELEVVPSPVGEGEQELTIDVWDFDPDTPVYVVPCEVPASGDAADVSSDSCDLADVETATTDADGAASFEVTWDIPADGIAVFAGDEMGTDEVAEVLEVAGTGVEVLGTSTTADDELADTGADTGPLVSLGLALVLLGTATVRTGRRLVPVTA